MAKKPHYYPGIAWQSPPGDEDGRPRCPYCRHLMVKLYLRRRYYLQNRRKLVWSGFWYCNTCESIDTTGSFGKMKYESDHHSPEWPDYPAKHELPPEE